MQPSLDQTAAQAFKTKLNLIKKNSMLKHDGGTMGGNLTAEEQYAQMIALHGMAAETQMMPTLTKTKSRVTGGTQSMAKRDQFIEIYRDGQIEYLQVKDPHIDINRVKAEHMRNLDCPVYAAQHMHRVNRIRNMIEKERNAPQQFIERSKAINENIIGLQTQQAKIQNLIGENKQLIKQYDDAN